MDPFPSHQPPDPVRRPRKACLYCRSLKTRCMPEHEASLADSRCARCATLGLVCEYVSAQRRRQPKQSKSASPIRGTSRTDSLQAKTSTSFMASRGETTTTSWHECLHLGSDTPAVVSSTPRSFDRDQISTTYTSKPSKQVASDTNATLLPHEWTTNVGPLPEHQLFGSTLKHTSRSGKGPLRSTLPYDRASSSIEGNADPSPKDDHQAWSADLVPYLDPPDIGTSRPGGGMSQASAADQRISAQTRSGVPLGEVNPFQDPITLGYLNVLEAQNLVQLYHTHLNPLIGLLDPRLHTFEFLTKTSSILTSLVLASSSKFFRKDLHMALQNHASSTLNRVIAEGKCDLGVLQSILVYVYWKPPTDKSSWLKVGMALRMGYQLRLHAGRNNADFPKEEHAARLLLNSERTWYCLACFDRCFSVVFRLPPTIRTSQVSDPEAWACEHSEWHWEEDIHLAFSLSAVRDQDLLIMELSSATGLSSKILDQADDDAQAMLNKWFNSSKPSLFTPMVEPLMKAFAFQTIFNMKQVRLRLFPTPENMDRCVLACGNVINQMQLLADNGQLQYLHDVGSLMLSNVGMALHQIASTAPPRIRSDIFQMMIRVHTFCSRVSASEVDSAPSFVARFYGRLLRAFTPQSLASSCPSTPLMTGGMATNNTQQREITDELFRLDPVFDHAPILSAQEVMTDEAYWSYLLNMDYPLGEPVEQHWG